MSERDRDTEAAQGSVILNGQPVGSMSLEDYLILNGTDPEQARALADRLLGANMAAADN